MSEFTVGLREILKIVSALDTSAVSVVSGGSPTLTSNFTSMHTAEDLRPE